MESQKFSFSTTIIALLMTVAAIAQSTPNYRKLSNGVELTIKSNTKNDAKLIKVEVVTEDILHITASPSEIFSRDKSLMIQDTNHPPVKYEIREQQGIVILSTASLSANIVLGSGVISFNDKSGKIILQESKTGSKSFIETILEGEQSYIVRQSFASNESEAFYGLGQHQNGVFNYKGTKVLLSQYNTEVGVPFMVSSNNYGILWDNNSITKSIDTKEYERISSLKLFSPKGEVGWLDAVYYDKKNKGKILAARPESFIDYRYISSLKDLPAGLALENATVKWEGFFETNFTGEYIFNLWYSGYVKLYIDDVLLADRWRQGWNASNALIKLNLQKGTRHKLVIEWDPLSNESFIALDWAKPLSAEQKNEFAFESEVGTKIDYYFVRGKNLDEVISGYRLLTGKATLIPKWAFGFWQSRERYKTQEEILLTVAEFRKRKIGIDNIVLDWRYWREGQWGSQEFDSTRFPDAAGMIRTLHDTYKTQLMISVWAKFYEDTKAYKDLDTKGFILKRNVVDGRNDWLGFKNAIYDPYNPAARKAFWDLINTKIYSKGIDAWWMDASEPDIHSNMSPEKRKEMIGHNFLGAPEKNYNAFSLLNAQGIYEGQRSVDPNKRVFLLTRSGFAGLQRYAAATWSGDIGSRWEDLKSQIPAGLNFSMSGLPYWTSDIGGFSVESRYENAKGETLEEWRELNARWYQYGAFCPLFRAHGQYPFREIFNIAPDEHPAYQSILYYNKLRYRLLPYIYSIAGKTYHEDYTLMRGLPMDFNTDKNVLNIEDQFMFGPAILVNPVSEYKSRSRNVYLPNTDGWYDFYTGKFIAGGQTIVADAPYEKLPLYVREGSIIPCGPNVQYTAEKSTEPFTIYVYTGKDASFDLYEDEGLNYNYEKGQFSTIRFAYSEATKTLSIEERKGSFTGMEKQRAFKIVWISKNKPAVLAFESKPDETVKYNGKKVIVKMKN